MKKLIMVLYNLFVIDLEHFEFELATLHLKYMTSRNLAYHVLFISYARKI